MMNSAAHFSDQLLSFLARQSWYALLYFVIALLLSRLFRRHLPIWSHLIWVIFFLRLLLPPDFSHPLSLRALVDHFLAPNGITLHQPDLSSVGLGESEKAAESVKSSHLSAFKRIFTAQTCIMVWLIGVFIFLLRLIANRLQWSRAVRRAVSIQDPFLISLADEWARYFAVRRRVRLLALEKTLSSFTIGVFRPVIVMPKRLIESASPHCLEAVISHEMAHIKRFDDLWKMAQNFVQIIYFFHPAVWFAAFQLNAGREYICDSMVLAQKKLPALVYGQALITTLKSASSDLAGLSPVFFSTKQVLNQRIHFIKKGKTMQPSTLTKILFIIIAAAVLPMAGSSKPTAEAQSAAMISEDSQLQLMNPLPEGSYKLTAPFGMHKHPITGKNVFHRAVDLAAPTGTQVSAAADGMVVKTFLLASAKPEDETASGNYVEIEHGDGLRTRYTQLSAVSVVEQQSVRQGEKIGEVGSSGISTGPHLHFEVIKDGQYVNPQDYIQF